MLIALEHDTTCDPPPPQLIRQRVAHKGQGRGGGYRTILAFRAGERSVFPYDFAKNETENI